MKNFKHYIILLLLLFSLVACGGGGGSDSNSPPPEPPLADSGKVLSSGTYVTATDSWSYQHLRLPNKTGGYAYAQYFQANGAGPHPVIVMTNPYDGIDWTGEAVDARWADQYKAHLAGGGTPSMCTPDVDGPDFDSNTSSQTCYTLSDEKKIGDAASIYLFNNYSVLVTYGRFYAGGSVKNDIEDVVAGLRFLGTQNEIDKNQIGIIGASWGGFVALYAALNAPANVRPAAVVPIFPVSDFEELINFVSMDLPGLVSAPVLSLYNQFYDPFLRRFYASAGKPPVTNFTGYTTSDLTALVDMPILIPHDDGDTILPATISHTFANAKPDMVEGFWYKRLDMDMVPWETVIANHGGIGDSLLVPIHFAFSSTFLFTRLNDTGRNLYIPYAEQDMLNFFNDIRTYQSEVRDVSWLIPRLIEMCDTTIFMYDLTPGNAAPITPGTEYLAQSLNTVWGTTLNAATVRQYLIDTGLPPS